MNIDVDEATLSSLTSAQCAEKMESVALSYFSSKHIDEPEISVDVDFELIDYLSEYNDIKGLERIFLGDSVRVISSRLGVDTYVRVNSYSYDCIAKRYTKISMESDAKRGGLLGTIKKYVSTSTVNNYTTTGSNVSFASDTEASGVLV